MSIIFGTRELSHQQRNNSWPSCKLQDFWCERSQRNNKAHPNTNYIGGKQLYSPIHYLSHRMSKPTKWPVRLAKTKISLGIRPVWPESPLCTQWVAKDPRCLQADSKDSDQTGPRLIWVFAGCTGHFVGLVMRRLSFNCHCRCTVK